MTGSAWNKIITVQIMLNVRRVSDHNVRDNQMYDLRAVLDVSMRRMTCTKNIELYCSQ